MENNPRKSKALIITFIIVLLLLIGGYLLFTRDSIFGVENNVSKKFSPLFGTPKEKDLIDTQNPDGTNTPNEEEQGEGTQGENLGGDNTNVDSNQGLSGIEGDQGSTIKPGSKILPIPGSGSTVSSPTFTPQCNDKVDNDGDGLVDTKDPGCHTDGNANNTRSYDKDLMLEFNFIPQCSDKVDNDKDGLVDEKDPGCHTDGNANNILSYTPEHTLEFGTRAPEGEKTVAQCNEEEIPLEFTAEEKIQLEELTRQFYRLSPRLKSENDVDIELNTAQAYQDLIDTATNLTIECYDQTYNGAYLSNSFLNETTEEKVLIPAGIDFSKGRFDFVPEREETITHYNYSILNEGRTERRRNPFQTRPSDGRSYFEVYNMVDGVRVYPWREFEDLREVW